MSFSFAHITDHHLLHREDELKLGFSPGHAFRCVLRKLSELAGEIDFVVCSGDLVETPDLESYALAKKMMGLGLADQAPGAGTLNVEGFGGMPIYFLPGNHDDRENFYSLFANTNQRGLMNAAFEHKGVRFICLDLSPAVKGDMSAETLGFLSEHLNTEPTVILTHHPLVKVGAKWLDKYLADNLAPFWELLEGKNILGTLSGHVHISYAQQVNGIPVIGTRSTAFQFAPQDEKLIVLWPPHVRVVTVSETTLESKIIEVSLD
jgi:3',5'-cyclic AMP phosphodiesterase CpdA